MRTPVAVTVFLVAFVMAASPCRANAQAPAASGAAATDTSSVRVFGGLLNIGGTTGFLAGGGMGFRPFSNTQLEIQADGTYGRLGGGSFDSAFVTADTNLSVIQISGDFLFNFRPHGERRMVPFAGGGLVFNRSDASVEVTVSGVGSSEVSAGSSDTALQLLGGIDLPVGAKRSFRTELRLQFFADTALVVLGGLSF